MFAYGPADAAATHCLLLSFSPDWLLHFWYRLTRVVPEKGPLNEVNVSVPFPFPSLSLIPIPMGLPWDSRSHWESHPHRHVYSTPLALSTKPPW